MARSLDAIARLWDAVTEAAGDDGGDVGFCLDTCHANSAGIDLLINGSDGIATSGKRVYCSPPATASSRPSPRSARLCRSARRTSPPCARRSWHEPGLNPGLNIADFTEERAGLRGRSWW
jgi:hypothetical protein